MTSILIVDDDKQVAAAIRMALEEEGYAVEVAHDAATARRIVGAPSRPDACLLDVFMDGEDGLALAAELQGEGAPPVVIMSGGGPGRSLESVTARADALGAVAVLFKPFDDDELLDAVRRATGERADGASPDG